jgi:hypothetical protein
MSAKLTGADIIEMVRQHGVMPVGAALLASYAEQLRNGADSRLDTAARDAIMAWHALYEAERRK